MEKIYKRILTIFFTTALLFTVFILTTATPICARPGVWISKTQVTIKEGKTTGLKLKNAMGKTISKNVVWKTSNKKIATVSKKGVVKGKNAGTAVIRGKHRGRSYRCIVTVKKIKTIKPKTPDFYSLSRDYNGGAILYWDGDPKTTDGYEVYRAISENDTFSLIGDVPDAGIYGENGFEDTDAEPRGKRCYKIRAYKRSGSKKIYSAYTEIKSVIVSLDMQYDYRVRFIGQPYAPSYSVFYVETENPEVLTYEVLFYGEDGEIAQSTAISIGNYDNTSNADIHGHILHCRFTKPGRYTVKVRERIHPFYADSELFTEEITLGTIVTRDLEAEENAWMQGIIDEVTTPDMSKREKMSAISYKLFNISKYTKSYVGGYIYLLEDGNKPYFILKEWNSFSTPIILVNFGKMIDYPLENLYYKYEVGTKEWDRYHMIAYSEEDHAFFQCCNPTDTNWYDIQSIDELPRFDFDGYTGYYDCQ